MTTRHDVVFSREISAAIRHAEDRARDTELTVLSGTLTRTMDPNLQFGDGFANHLPKDVAAQRTVTRLRILEQAADLAPTSSAATLQQFAWLVSAWGYGTVGYGATRTRRVLQDCRFGDAVRVALEILHDTADTDAAVRAYYWLRNATGHVHGWGPAFFTKFLAFADPANQPGSQPGRRPALILDQWIAAAMNHYLPADLRQRPTRTAPLGIFGKQGWRTCQYAYYLALVDRLAQSPQFAGEPYDGVPMHVERVLFHYFRDGDGRVGQAGRHR